MKNSPLITIGTLLSAALILSACTSGADSAAPASSAAQAAPAGGGACDSTGKAKMPTQVPGMAPPATKEAPISPTHQDIAYATKSPAQKLDLYLPAGANEKTPLLIDIHGGGFLFGDKRQEAELVVEEQVKQGYAVASINYRMACEAKFPAGVQDVKAAIRWLRAHAAEYRLDPDRFATWGQSAGAYLSTMAAVTGDQKTVFDDDSLGNPGVSSAVQGAVSWYGPYDFGAMDGQFATHRPAACTSDVLAHGKADSPESTWLGGALDSVADKAKQANPATYLATARTIPPISFAAGDSDCAIPHQQSEDMHDAVKAAGGQATLAIVKGAGHGPAVDQAQTGAALEFVNGLFKRK
ncbi:alpha/beta hydrolase fold domain-containing protein [Amycolatopsis sp. NPDC059090]|uniref:alpha/beta hydrolase fold domain-containing protein n=1 Tax=unclassified Amycolatopsis TaxID=2618356 RepID=UPI00367342AE